jgi:transcriptional regulator with XRE-family HTH domain
METMLTQNESLKLSMGQRISELRKKKGLSQSALASRLTHRRTQAWVSNVESGRRQVGHGDLFEIASILGTTLSGFYSYLSPVTGSKPKSFSDVLNELEGRLPIEMPVYLQSDLGKPDPEPIDFQYSSAVPGRALFTDNHPLARSGTLAVMVVERHYSNPKMDPTDLLTFSSAVLPVPDPDDRIAERIIVLLSEPLDGLVVHAGISKKPGEVEIKLAGRARVVLKGDDYKILGVVAVRRTLYRSSVVRAWIQRQHGVIKDERLIVSRSDD